MAEKWTSEQLAAAEAQFTRPCDFMLSVAQLVQLPDSDLDEVAFAAHRQGRAQQMTDATLQMFSSQFFL